MPEEIGEGQHSGHFINLSFLSNFITLRLCKAYVNTIASHMGFHKSIFCVFLTQQVFLGWIYKKKKCQDFQLKKTMKGLLSSSITVVCMFVCLYMCVCILERSTWEGSFVAGLSRWSSLLQLCGVTRSNDWEGWTDFLFYNLASFFSFLSVILLLPPLTSLYHLFLALS